MQPDYYNTLLISPSELKSESLINSNTDDKPLSNIVTTIQEIYLVKILGTPLLRKLQELVYNEVKGLPDNITQEGNEQYLDLLSNYVKPYLRYHALKSFIVENSFKFRNAGVVRVSDTNLNYASVDDIKFLQSHFETYIAEFEDRLSKYLCANKSKFPELGAEIPSYMDTPSVGKDYSNTGGLWLGSKNNSKCNGC